MGTGSVMQHGLLSKTNKSRLEEGTQLCREWSSAVLETLGSTQWQRVGLRQMSGIVVMVFARWVGWLRVDKQGISNRAKLAERAIMQFSTR
jgi:hypothetical protein